MSFFDDSLTNTDGKDWPEASTQPAEVAHRVYEEYRNTIHAYLMSLRIEAERARDLTQECFFKYYLVVRAGEDIRDPRPWLFKTASRLALNHFREVRTERTVSSEELSAGQLDAQYQVGSGEDQIIRNDRLERLADAIQTLSPQQQMCLHLRAEGLRYREIAEVLEVSVPTVSEFIRRGIARLKRTLDA